MTVYDRELRVNNWIPPSLSLDLNFVSAKNLKRIGGFPAVKLIQNTCISCRFLPEDTPSGYIAPTRRILFTH